MEALAKTKEKKMKIIHKSLLTFSGAMILITQLIFAGNDKNVEKQVVVSRETPQRWNAQLTEGWDSLYMHRGVNMLRNGQNYGSSLLWTDLNATFNITPSDSLNVDVWNAFGIGHTNFKETDAMLMYTHTFGNLFVSVGYMLMAMTEDQCYSNELHGMVGYNIPIGPATLTPSVLYFFNLGPNATTDMRGMAPTASSYLLFRLDGSIPLYKNTVFLEPWISYAQNFRYNAKMTTTTSSMSHDGMTMMMSHNTQEFFNGANNFEVGISLPIRITKIITVSGYGAYSYNFNGLMGTALSTFWGGAKVTFSF